MDWLCLLLLTKHVILINRSEGRGMLKSGTGTIQWFSLGGFNFFKHMEVLGIEQRPRHDHSCLLRQYETSQTNRNCKTLAPKLAVGTRKNNPPVMASAENHKRRKSPGHKYNSRSGE